MNKGVVSVNKKFLHNINEETYHLLYDDKYGENGEYYNPNLNILNCLLYYTKLNDTAINLLPIGKRNLYSIDNFSHDLETNTYRYKDDNFDFKFWKISDLFTDKKSIKELTTDKRIGDCFELSFRMCKYFTNSKVLTGYAIVDRCLILHSVIELGNGKIFDWTMNAILDKDKYCYLRFFKPISEVKSEDLINDSKTMLNQLDMPYEVYLTCRDSLVKDYNRALKR